MSKKRKRYKIKGEFITNTILFFTPVIYKEEPLGRAVQNRFKRLSA